MSGPGCEELRESLSAFVDERLEGPELLALEAHLERCEACRAFEAGLRRFPELLRASEAFRPLRQPPPGFAARVTAALAAGAGQAVAVPFPVPRPARRGRVASLGLFVAAAAAALLFAWSWQRLLPGEPAGQRQAAAPPPPAAYSVASAGEGSMDSWLESHATLARGGTLLGPAEEIEFAGYRPSAGER